MKTQNEKKYIFGEDRVCIISSRRFCGTGKHMEIPISCGKVWGRNLSADLYYTCTDFWIYDDYGGDFYRKNDEEEPGGSISYLWKIPLALFRWLDKCDYSGFNRAILFCNWRLGNEISGGIYQGKWQ